MPCLQVKFLNLELSSPFIAKVDTIASFEKDIILDYYGAIILPSFVYEKTNNHGLNEQEEYTDAIKNLKKRIKIPLIAGIDFPVNISPEEICIQIEKAGADALFLKIFSFPDDKDFHSYDYEKIYFETAAKVAYSVKIPIMLALPVYFTNLFNILEQLFYRGIQGFFPTSYNFLFDIDIDNFEVKPISSDGFDFYLALKWISYLSSFFPRADFFVQSNQSIPFDKKIKLMLTGCQGFIEKYDSVNIKETSAQIEMWMQKHGFEKTEHFLGQLNFQTNTTPSFFERANIVQKDIESFER